MGPISSYWHYDSILGSVATGSGYSGLLEPILDVQPFSLMFACHSGPFFPIGRIFHDYVPNQALGQPVSKSFKH